MSAALRLVVALCALGAAPSLAQVDPAWKSEVRLDLDGDGKLDLARLVDNRPRSRDLHIFYGVGDLTPGPDAKPDMIKAEIAENVFVGLSARGRGSLIVTSDCGGCTQSAVTTLTIVHRNGRLVVGGLEIDWEFREESGRCNVNFLTGRGAIDRNGAHRPRPIPKRLAPVPLERWEHHHGSELCFQ
jgi:hypothetical protein